MNQSGQSKNELIHLIDEAETEVRAKAAEANRPFRARSRVKLRPVVAAVIFLAFGAAGYELWQMNRTPTSQEVAHDLEGVVDLARAAVEDAVDRNGALPDVLPNASLASVVRYEPDQTGYQLTAELLGVRVTLESNGGKRVEFNRGTER